tara:strand:+ start:79 stop:720 length:642 start_codon:yes stop_codon:yes gene_type:complete
MKTKVKICGINSLKALKAANRADFLGFIFYGKSPRFVNAKKAKLLADSCLSFQKKVGLFVDSDNHVIEYITEYVGLDYIQLHGDENIEKIKYLKNKLNVPIIKSIPIKTIEDFQKLSYYEKVCDIILLDSKPSNNSLTGGTGKTFNWKLLKNISFEKEWMLAGGLNEENILDAIKITDAPIVDISSGLESSEGIKCPEKIKQFLDIVKLNRII